MPALPSPIRHDWTADEVGSLLAEPLLDLVHRAQSIHRRHHDPREIQCCALLSIKTGGCSEDCGYCPQSARHSGGVEPDKLMELDDVIVRARRAKAEGASRFCMGAAWRSAKGGAAFERVLDMVRAVAGEGMEVCCTLGMLTAAQAVALKEAGLTAYNHNLDTSAAHYDRIITTHTYEDRLQTLGRVREAGLMTCCGGIVGMGESRDDRAALLRTLAGFDPHPESVPINLLVRVPGTPLADAPDPDVFELVRTIAVARILMPASRVRLSAGRAELSREAQALCFCAGANSIFFGDTLLTTPNPTATEDSVLLADLGLVQA